TLTFICGWLLGDQMLGCESSQASQSITYGRALANDTACPENSHVSLAGLFLRLHHTPPHGEGRSGFARSEIKQQFCYPRSFCIRARRGDVALLKKKTKNRYSEFVLLQIPPKNSKQALESKF